MSLPLRILVVNPFGIGDVLFTTPLIRALRQAFPRSRLGYVCNRRTEGILRTNPHLDELFVYEKDELITLWWTSRRAFLRQLWTLLRRVSQARFDVAVDLSLGERYSLVLKVLGVRRRIGFDYRRRGRFLTERMAIDGYRDQHVVEYYRELLRAIGIELVEAFLELRVSEADERWTERWLRDHHLNGSGPLVGIVPAGGVSWGIDAPFRRWTTEGFAQVADALVDRYGARAILFGEAADTALCRKMARVMRHQPIDLSGQTTLGQFVSLLSRLALVICNDGGPLHLAVSQGVKTVSIFGPVDPQVYGPYPSDTGLHHVVYREGLPCRPCYHQFKLPPCPYERACLMHIDPSDVLTACETALRDARARHQITPADVTTA